MIGKKGRFRCIKGQCPVRQCLVRQCLVRQCLVRQCSARLCIVLVAVALAAQSGCGIVRSSPEKVQDIDYTVVEDEDIPKELAEMIDARKDEQMHLTYATNEYMYIVTGYGEQQSGGYSIRLDSIYLGENAIYIKTSLIGPQKKENISKAKTYPYIVVKIENRDEPVIFE